MSQRHWDHVRWDRVSRDIGWLTWRLTHWLRKSLASCDIAGLAGNVSCLGACSITPSRRILS